jgi:hypothetical protein
MFNSRVPSPPEWIRVLCILFVSSSIFSTGCSKEQVDELASKVQEQVAKAPDVVRDVLPTTGKVSLQLDRAVDIAHAEGDLYLIGASRPSLFQIRSYSKGDRESLPAVFLHAPVEAKSPGDLVGKVIEAQMFVRYDKALDIWSNRDNEAVKLMIQSYTDGKMNCQVLSGVLINPNGDTRPVSGDIQLSINAQSR